MLTNVNSNEIFPDHHANTIINPTTGVPEEYQQLIQGTN